jgi:hypothetical protein
MGIPRVPLDSYNEKQHRTVIATAVNELIKVRPPNDKNEYEASLGFTPVNTSYPPGHAFRWMSDEQINDVTSYAGLIDVTAALQNCLQSSHHGVVFLPKGKYLISASLPVYTQTISGASCESVIIAPNGNFECFVNSGIEFIVGSISQLTILYGSGTQPTSSVGNSRKIGIYWTAVGGKSPSRFDITDVQIRGAWWAYYDDSGSYACTIERVFAWGCQKGFYKSTGTTFHFKEAICLTVNEQFTMNHHQGLTMTCCAGDGAVIAAGETAILFDDCAGLVINGWDSEGNSLTGQDSKLIKINDSQFVLNGWTGHVNTQSSAAGENTQIFDIVNSQGTISACRPAYTAGDLTFSGLGSVFTLLARSGSKVTVLGGDIAAATGGSPALRAAMVTTGTGTIKYVSTTAATGVFSGNVYELSDTESGSFTATANAYTLVGSPTFTGTYVRNGKLVFATVIITANGGTTASVGGTSFVSGLPYNPTVNSVNVVSNSAAANIGTGLLRSDGRIYTPAWAASALNFTVTMAYQIT